jgi:D-alanine-D-alanine ligase
MFYPLIGRQTMRTENEPPGVVVLYNDTEDLIKGEARDLLAERGVIACAHAVANALSMNGYRVIDLPFQDDVELALESYPPDKWVVFNLGEGLSGRLFEEARIAWALEAMGYTFTGSNGNAHARCLNKAHAKKILADHHVQTPPGWLFRHPDEVKAVEGNLPFPLIVKPVAEGGSIGLDADAVVHTGVSLRQRVDYITSCYRQAALAETFILGREFNIALWGDPPQVLPLAEVDFSAIPDPHERIVSFAAKWEEDSFEYKNTPVVCPASVSSKLNQRITQTAQRAWHAMGCNGYARVDMRVSEQEIPYVVEVNCNPDLSPDAGFYRAARTAGFSYREMATRILEIARRQVYVEDRHSLGERWSFNFRSNSEGRSLQSNGSKLRRRIMERVQEI